MNDTKKCLRIGKNILIKKRVKRVEVRNSSEPYLRTLFFMLLGVKRAIDMDIFETSALLRELMLSHMTFIPFICVQFCEEGPEKQRVSFTLK